MFKIAIDGASGTGKSSLAKFLAKEFGLTYIDSGALYRLVAYAYFKYNGVIDKDLPFISFEQERDSNLGSFLDNKLWLHNIEFHLPDNHLYVDGEDMDSYIRTPAVSSLASTMSKQQVVRDFVSDFIKKTTQSTKIKGIIIDGRDIGTVVMPDADLKLFMTTDFEVRVDRRYEQTKNEYKREITKDEISNNMYIRDKQDSERENCPLKPAEDAVFFDNTNYTFEQTCLLISGMVNDRMKECKQKVVHKHSGKRLYQYDCAYMEMAYTMSKLSYAIRKKVGCVIVKDGQIVSQGYNGTPTGFNNCCEIVNPDGTLTTRENVLHAESNAITKCSKSHSSTKGATLYVTDSPCIHCAKLIIQSGIEMVLFAEPYRDLSGVKLIKEAGIDICMLNSKENVDNGEDAYITELEKIEEKIIKKC